MGTPAAERSGILEVLIESCLSEVIDSGISESSLAGRERRKREWRGRPAFCRKSSASSHSCLSSSSSPLSSSWNFPEHNEVSAKGESEAQLT